MAPPFKLTFVQSAERVSQLPATRAEVTFVGRSNVGKSSLINALANRKNLAHVSNTPGRTRLLNMFEIDKAWPTGGAASLMDLPGYGFAKAPAAMRQNWGRMIEAYLLERENLEMVVVLVDGVVGPTALDLQMLDWLRSHEIPHTVVATKHDKVKSSQRDKRKVEVADKCELEVGDIIWVSSEKGTGLDRLRTLMRAWLS
ncbi:MAG: ribosome biogenesis GTP-binding protein YihA/YsxC [Acidimicrobiales bacterium]